jgi:capsule synthesis protein PGA_cap
MSRLATALIASAIVASGVAAMKRSSGTDTRLLFAGDILLARQVSVEIDRTGASPWSAIAPLLTKADFVFGNFEGAIGDSTNCRRRDSLCFASRRDAPQMLHRAGFDVVSVENNHAGDLGREGRAATRDALRRDGILGLDFQHSPRFTRVGELTIATIAITLVPAADGTVEEIPSIDVAQKLRLARALANVVVVSVHWGRELSDWPSEDQRSAARWLVSHGADIIVGHHPHVVQEPECVEGRPVFFSLGNHVFDQRYPASKKGLIADCTVRDGTVHCVGLRTQTRRGSATPTLAGEQALSSACDARVHETLEVSRLTLRAAPWSASDADSGIVVEAWKGRSLVWRTRSVSLVSIDTGVATGTASKLLLTLERHPSPMDGEVALRPHVYAVGPRGLIAKWRGTALAWPLRDAVVDDAGNLCVLHRGDSFLRPDTANKATRIMRYRWNGFGFSGMPDEAHTCALRFSDLRPRMNVR